MAAQLQLLAGEASSKETQRAIQACNDWLRLGPGRTITLLLAKYGKRRGNAAPTESRDTLEHWSANHKWQERAAQFDAIDEALRNERRREAMEEGLALDYERVIELKKLAAFLKRQIYELGSDQFDEGKKRNHNVWVRDVKSVGSGEFATEYGIERYNGALVGDYFHAIADIAAETGGRKVKPEGPKDNMEEELKQIAAGLDRKVANLVARARESELSTEPLNEGEGGTPVQLEVLGQAEPASPAG